MPITCVKKNANRASDLAFREILAANSNHKVSVPRNRLERRVRSLPPLHLLDEALKDLSEEVSIEAILHAMLYMLAGSNREVRDLIEESMLDIYEDVSACEGQAFVARSISVIQAFACRQRFHHLTPSEVAGVAVGGLADCVVHLELSEVIETCGMGADKGFGNKPESTIQYKTINVSTLSALVLASMGYPAIKHGSYGNTSKVASSNAADMLGIPRHFDSYEAMINYFQETGFLYLEAGVFKTVHDLSHMIKHETINHILGPMSVPVSSDTTLHKLIGLNNHMDPSTVVKAYNILHNQGYQTMGGIMAICGLGADVQVEDFDLSIDNDLYRATVIDEISPHGTLLAVGCEDDYFGQVVIHLSDFGDCSFTEDEIMIPNEVDAVRSSNLEALQGTNRNLVDYLAANAALALIAYKRPTAAFVSDQQFRRRQLREAYGACRSEIYSGRVMKYMQGISPNLNI